MVSPAHLVWLFFIIAMALALVALIEIHRINVRRDSMVMFGSDVFDEKVKEYGLEVKEIHTLEKLVRASKFENKDAVMNSASLFENAVSDFYEFRNVFTIRDETLASVEKLREMLGFTAKNPLAVVYSTRQFAVGDRVDVLLESGEKLKHSEILWKNEKEWSVLYDSSFGAAASFVGKNICIRWTRPEDAVYSAWLTVRSSNPGEFIIAHSTKLEKQQLRRWVREQVNFPVEAVFADGCKCKGCLYDLSAGGILIGLPRETSCGEHLHICFELPSFGPQDVEIEILRNLGHKNAQYPELFSMTASFIGAFGWTQESVLQYIFEVHKSRKMNENVSENT